jgi:hypothetical protein
MLLLLVEGNPANSQQLVIPISPVEVQMRAVNLHLNRTTVLEVVQLRGQMTPTRREQPVTFDDVNSFTIRIRSAEIAVSSGTLSDLLNQVFASTGTPLRKISIDINEGKVTEKGILHKGIDMPFVIEGTLDVGATGELRLHAKHVEAAHIPVKSLMHLFGEDLSRLINIKRDRGVRFEGDDVFLDPGNLLPPPKIEGKVTKIRTEANRVILTFGSGGAKDLDPPFKAASYIYHRGGVLRFGKLTMLDSDLELVSSPPHAPFDFSLPDYNRQLVAGYSKNTSAHGLIVFMPDLKALPSSSLLQLNRTDRINSVQAGYQNKR